MLLLLVLVPVHTLAATLLSFGWTPAQVREWQMEEWATQVNQATEQALLNESLRAFPSFTGVCI